MNAWQIWDSIWINYTIIPVYYVMYLNVSFFMLCTFCGSSSVLILSLLFGFHSWCSSPKHRIGFLLYWKLCDESVIFVTGITEGIIRGICKVLLLALPRYRDSTSQFYIRNLIIALVKQHGDWTVKHLTSALSDIAAAHKNLVSTLVIYLHSVYNCIVVQFSRPPFQTEDLLLVYKKT